MHLMASLRQHESGAAPALNDFSEPQQVKVAIETFNIFQLRII